MICGLLLSVVCASARGLARWPPLTCGQSPKPSAPSSNITEKPRSTPKPDSQTGLQSLKLLLAESQRCLTLSEGTGSADAWNFPCEKCKVINCRRLTMPAIEGWHRLLRGPHPSSFRLMLPYYGSTILLYCYITILRIHCVCRLLCYYTSILLYYHTIM